MSVVQYEAPQPLPPSRPGDELAEGPAGDVARLRAAAEYAGYIGDTEFVPETLRGRAAAITAALLAGDELGLKKMAALRTIAIIKGRPTLTAEAQRGLVVAKGHELWFEESTVTRAIAAGRRAGEDRIGRVTWTLDDAKRAQIAGQPNWQRYPAEMLRARASAALARAMFADEPENGVAPASIDAPPPSDAPPAPRRTPRRRQPAAAPSSPAAGPAPAEDATPALPPTPPPDEQTPPPVPDEPLATDAYKRRIFASMRDLGLGAGLAEDAARELRLAYTSKAVGRTVASSNELTIGEASRVIEQLEADKASRAAGETAFLDELMRELDATPEPEAPEPADPEQPETGPIPYNELPEGF